MSTPGEAGKIQISSHSYGFISGWAREYNPPRWYGNWGEPEAASFGLYDWYAAQWDDLCYNAPYFLPFKSSGNNRIYSAPGNGNSFKYFDNGWLTKPYIAATDPAGDDTVNGGYDTIPLIGNAKNVMTVGAVDDAVAGGERSLAEASMTSFSGWGPTDDGRIKPDIVANGAMLYSSKASSDSSYGLMTGTSMSTPNAAGSALLILERYQELFGGETMPASQLKGLILHTADDLGNPGPDYRFGWGLMNTLEAVKHLDAHAGDPDGGQLAYVRVNEDVAHESAFVSDGHQAIRITIAWTDPAAPYTYDLDDRSSRLVNDLDLRVIGPDGTTFLPYRLDPENPNAPATMGDNQVDNVEQIHIAQPVAGAYRVIVEADGSLVDGRQDVAFIRSGLAADKQPPVIALQGTVETTEDGSGYAFVSGLVTDPDQDLCHLEVEYSVDGAAWRHAHVADASTPSAPLVVENESEMQITGVPATPETAFSLTWDSRGSQDPVDISDTTRIRVRAFDGALYSEWANSSVFAIDNVGPDNNDVVVTESYSAHNRYLVDPTLTISWSHFVDTESEIDGYFVGIGRRQVLDLPFLDALGRWIRQEAPTTLALLHMVDFCVIGLFDHFERMSRYVRAVRRIFVCLSCAGFWARVS